MSKYILIAILIGIMISGMIPVDVVDTVYEDVKLNFQEDYGIINGIMLVVIYIGKVLVDAGMTIGASIGYPLSFYLGIFLIIFSFLWYPVAWLLCLIGIILSDSKKKKEVKS